MESYAENRATPIFFVVYIIITLYFASNIVRINRIPILIFMPFLPPSLPPSFFLCYFLQLLAVVYSSFSEADKMKFRKILCHKMYNYS